MNRFVFSSIAVLCIGIGAAAVVAQSSPDDERRDAIRLLRAMNTAENNARSKGGAHLQLADLLNHPSMGGVKADFSVSGTTYTYKGSQVRLALSADATQYVITVVSGAPNYTAAFTDERGVIYTGKALE